MHPWDPDPGLGDSSQVAHGATTDEILRGYPDLEPTDIEQALRYAAWLTREVRSP